MTVKGEYIRRTLLDESSRWLKNQNTVLATKLCTRTGRLVNERSMSVSEQGEMSATMTYQHTIEERFLDMRVLRYGSKLVRRAREIFRTRFAYGHYESIASRLMYGLTHDVVAEIKQQLTD